MKPAGDNPPLPRSGSRICLALAALVLLAGGCRSHPSYQINLMPAPEVYATGTVDPFMDFNTGGGAVLPFSGILYATDRKPAQTEGAFYQNRRGALLRLGLANVVSGENTIDWEEARRVSLLKNRNRDYPLQVAGVEEFGILDRSVSELTDPSLLPPDWKAAAARYAEVIDAKLERSRRKEIFIYVHGYKVVFDNPILVTAELWHFLGYDGVAIAFSWPSTPSTWAYASDLETAFLSAYRLRVLLTYLAEETRAERINIIGYSAGTRLVIAALHQLALMNAAPDADAGRTKPPIGQVILIGSDYDRDLFGAALVNGLLEVPQSLTVYLSETDKALGMSRRLFRRNRLGEMWTERPLKPHVAAYIRRNDSLVLIDVTDAEAAAAGNGHAYFRQSPWVSSDILISLLYGLEPRERGLVRLPDVPVWSFPEDYISRLQGLLREKLPGF